MFKKLIASKGASLILFAAGIVIDIIKCKNSDAQLDELVTKKVMKALEEAKDVKV